MKQLMSSRTKAVYYNTSLCRSMGFTETPVAEYTRYFAECGYSISIRPFCIKTDFPLAYEWLSRTYEPHQWKQSAPGRQMEDTYRMMLESDLVQPFIVLQNNQPVCFIDIYQGIYHELSLHYDMQPDDYVIQYIMAPHKKTDRMLVACILQTCLHYFYSYREVKRIISDPNILDTLMNEAMIKAGFRLISQLDTPYKRSNLYYCTLSSFVLQLT